MLKHLKRSYEQGGFRACLLTFFQPGVDVFYTSAELNEITTMGLSFQEGLSALVEADQGSNFSETETPGLNGELYIQNITLATGVLTAARRELLHRLQQNRVHALVQDLSGNWWLYGQDRGMRIRVKADSSAGVTLTIGGLEKAPARLVAASLVPGFLTFLN